MDERRDPSTNLDERNGRQGESNKNLHHLYTILKKMKKIK
jgi:hypothetical protein